jgi:carbonic anhydrase/acetyltransferase-like protein (isoleucine patch superfamily)
MGSRVAGFSVATPDGLRGTREIWSAGAMAVIRAFKGVFPQFGARVFVAEGAAVIGAVELAEDVSVWYGVVLRGDVGRIVIGARTNIQDNVTLHMTTGVSDALIGSDVTVGHNAVIHGAIIEAGALIGMQSVVMDNARVGAGSWVAAGSVVPPNLEIPPGVLVRGSPARVVREVKPEERDWAAQGIARYLELAREHRAEQLASGIYLPPVGPR